MDRVILKWIEKSEGLTMEEKVIISFGINQAILLLINFISLVVFGGFIGGFVQSTILLCLFIPLRTYAGGYHADTKLRCYVLSNIMFLLIMYIFKSISISNVLISVLVVLLSIQIYILAPIDNVNNRLSKIQKHLYQKKLLKLIVFEIFVCTFLQISGMKFIMWIELCVLFLVLLLQLLGIVKNKVNQEISISTIIR